MFRTKKDMEVSLTKERYDMCLRCGQDNSLMLKDAYPNPIFTILVGTMQFSLCESCLKELTGSIIPRAIEEAESSRKVYFRTGDYEEVQEGILLRVDDDSFCVEVKESSLCSKRYDFPKDAWNKIVFKDRREAEKQEG